MGGHIFLFGGPFSKTLEGEFLPGQRRHESGTHVDQVVLPIEGILGSINIGGPEESLGKFHENIGTNTD